MLGELTARQLAILAASAGVIYLAGSIAARWWPLPVIALCAAPLAVAGVVLALGRRDGIPVHRLLVAVVQHRVTHRRLTPHRAWTLGLALPDPISDPHRAGSPTGDPGSWSAADPRGRVDGVRGPGMRWGRERFITPAQPVRRVRRSRSGPEVGMVDLGRDGTAALVAVTGVNLTLRSAGERDALLGGFARWLHSLTQPVQILVRTQPVNLSPAITTLHCRASILPHPALAAAAHAHAEHLSEIGAQTDLLGRQILLVFRDPHPTTTAAAGYRGRTHAREHHTDHHTDHHTGGGASEGAGGWGVEEGLRRRVEEAISLLSAAGIHATGLDAAQTTGVLHDALRPDRHAYATDGQAQPSSPPSSVSPLPPSPPVSGRLPFRASRGPTDPSALAAPGPFDPPWLGVGARHVRVGQAWVATLVVLGYPHDALPGWLSTLTSHPALLEVSIHAAPVHPAVAAARLRRQLARFESGRRHRADYGQLIDPHLEAATSDAYDLSTRLTRGQTRLAEVTVTLTVRAATPAQLDRDLAELRSLASSMLLDVRSATHRPLRAWITGLPVGIDQLAPGRVGGGRVMDSDALAALALPVSPDLPGPDPAAPTAPDGVLYGHNLASHNLVIWDRFACDNYNSVILGRSGSGKSYLTKLELLRSLYRGVTGHVIDPEDEYLRLGAAIGATVIRLGAPGVHLNPFDLPIHTHPDTGARTAPPDALDRRMNFLHTLLAVLLAATPTPTERAVLDAAIAATYRRAAITTHPATWTRRAPLLTDLHQTLLDLAHPTQPPGTQDQPDTSTGTGASSPPRPATEPASASAAGLGFGLGAELQPVAAALAVRLRPYVDGAFAGLFTGPTSTPPEGHLVVWSLRELTEELRPVATLLALDRIWAQVTHPHDRRPRLITIDEAWMLLRQPEAATWLLRTAKSARKHWAGLTITTQDSADVLATDLGRAVVANAATQLLLRQAPQAIDHITRTFDLTTGEHHFLLNADRGDGLLLAGRHRAAFHTTASPTEHNLVTTDPTDLAAHTPLTPAWITLDQHNHQHDHPHDEQGNGWNGSWAEDWADGWDDDQPTEILGNPVGGTSASLDLAGGAGGWSGARPHDRPESPSDPGAELSSNAADGEVRSGPLVGASAVPAARERQTHHTDTPPYEGPGQQPGRQADRQPHRQRGGQRGDRRSQLAVDDQRRRDEGVLW